MLAGRMVDDTLLLPSYPASRPGVWNPSREASALGVWL